MSPRRLSGRAPTARPGAGSPPTGLSPTCFSPTGCLPTGRLPRRPARAKTRGSGVLLAAALSLLPCAAAAQAVATDGAQAGEMASGQAGEQAGGLTVELNKFEEIEGSGCRAYFLFRNRTGTTYEGFEMSLAILDADGVIDRLLSIDAAPLPVARTTLKLFEIPDLACSDISEILLHEMTSCRPQNAEETDCFPLVTLASKTPARLVK